jgi:biotin carboxyl carrier protein
MDFEFVLDGRPEVISLIKKEGRLVMRRGETRLEAEVETLADGTISFLIGSRSYLAYIGRDDTRILVSIGGEKVALLVPDRQASRSGRREEAGPTGVTLVKAPMPGKLIKLGVAEGQAVRKNQVLAIVEAMKMENEVRSPREAKVRRVFVAAGELVDSDRPLIELEPLS